MDSSATARTQSRYDRQAGLYDLNEAPIELFLFRGLRRRLWADTGGGTILEVGVGTGKNVPRYPPDARVVAVDLSPRMLKRAASRARRLGRAVDLVLADAEHLPFRDGAFDTVAATFVFCSVPDPVAGLGEMRRAVRAGGRVRLLEHVRAANRLVGGMMDLMNPVWVRLSGANINRDTVSNVAKAGIAVEAVESRGFGLLKLIRGVGPGAPGAKDVAQWRI
jgi:ubiquinone/menaquinone biosynthesis C-methylase UbiE